MIDTDTIPVANHYDEIAETYDESYIDPVSLSEYRLLRRLIRRYLIPGSVIDLGTGTGLYLDLGFRPASFLGIDFSAGMIAHAQSKFPEYKFLQGDFTNLPDETTPFPFDNVISLNGPLSYPENMNFSCITRLLRPGGRYLFTVYGKAENGTGRYFRSDRGHTDGPKFNITRYTTYSLRERLEAAGLRVFGFRGMSNILPLGDASSGKFLVNRLHEILDPDNGDHIIAYGERPNDRMPI